MIIHLYLKNIYKKNLMNTLWISDQLYHCSNKNDRYKLTRTSMLIIYKKLSMQYLFRQGTCPIDNHTLWLSSSRLLLTSKSEQKT